MKKNPSTPSAREELTNDGAAVPVTALTAAHGGYLEQEDAIRLLGISLDTLRRWRRDDHLPNSRTNAKGKVEVSIIDLIAFGKLDPTAAAVPVDEFAGKSRLERELNTTRTELAVATARLEDAQRQINVLHEILIMRGAA